MTILLGRGSLLIENEEGHTIIQLPLKISGPIDAVVILEIERRARKHSASHLAFTTSGEARITK